MESFIGNLSSDYEGKKKEEKYILRTGYRNVLWGTQNGSSMALYCENPILEPFYFFMRVWATIIVIKQLENNASYSITNSICTCFTNVAGRHENCMLQAIFT